MVMHNLKLKYTFACITILLCFKQQQKLQEEFLQKQAEWYTNYHIIYNIFIYKSIFYV